MKYSFSEAELILSLRKAFGYSQKDFCVFLGYSQPTLSKIENGQLSPDMRFVIALAQKLNLDLNIFKYGYIPKLPDYLYSSRSSKLLRNPFLKDGVFPAKMTFLLLENLKTELEIDLYEKLDLPREIFPFLELKFNQDLFKELLRHIPQEKVIDVIRSVRVSSPTLMSDANFREALMRVALFELENIIMQPDGLEVGLAFREDIAPELTIYFQHLLSFYLLTELNINVTPVLTGQRRHDVVLRLYAS